MNKTALYEQHLLHSYGYVHIVLFCPVLGLFFAGNANLIILRVTLKNARVVRGHTHTHTHTHTTHTHTHTQARLGLVLGLV